MDQKELIAALMAAAETPVSHVDLSASTQRIKVDMDTRKITGHKEFGVIKDHLAENIIFEVKRYKGDTDLAEKHCAIHWENGKNGGVVPVTEIDLSEDGHILMRWELSDEFTQYAGSIAYALHFFSILDGGFTYHAATNAAVGTLGTTLNASAHSKNKITPSEIEVYIAKMNELSAAMDEQVVLAQEAATKAESIAEQLAEKIAKVEELTQKTEINKNDISKLSGDIATKASAIKEKASGETIVVTDSDEAKPLGLAIDGKSEQKQYSGKNLFMFTLTAPKTHLGVTFTPNSDGSITLNGSATSDIYLDIGTVSLEKDKRYRISGCPSGFGNKVAFYYNADAATGNHWNRGEATVFSPLNEGSKACTIQFKTGIVASNLTLYPMVTLASIEDDTFEPYCGGIPSPNPSYPQEIRNIGVYDEASGKYAVEVKGTGKNLLEYPYMFTTMNSFGVVYTDNGDGTITVNGTADADAYFGLFRNVDGQRLDIEKGQFIICAENVSKDIAMNYTLLDSNKNTLYSGQINNNYGEALLDVVEEGCTMYINLMVPKGTTISNVVVKPMIRLAEITDDTWEPYKETTATVYLDEPLRKGDKVSWNGGSKVRVDRYRAVEVFDGSDDEKWKQEANKHIFWTDKLKPFMLPSKDDISLNDIMSDCLIEKTAGQTWGGTEGISLGPDCCIWVKCSNVSLVDEWKTLLSERPMLVEYTLATQITEEIDIDLDSLTMFYPTTILSNDCNANMEVTYIADTKAYIDKLKAKHESDITALKTAIVALGGTV